MWVKIWKRGEKAKPTTKRAKFYLTTAPLYSMIDFQNLIHGRAYVERYKNGLYEVILEWDAIYGINNTATLPDEINYLAHLFANTIQIDAEVSDIYGIGGLIISGLALKGLVRR